MNTIQRITLCQFSLILVLLIATYGCQTANNTITPESSVANLQSNKEVTTIKKAEEIEKESLVEKQRNFLSRWSNLGHGGVAQDSSAEEETITTERSAGAEKGSFTELEKNVVGKWLNLKETESIEFSEDGTVVIIDKRGVNPKLKGSYRFLDEGRLRVAIIGGLYAKSIPLMSFKISISENEIILTDEPDGAATTYKRIK